MEAAGDGVLIGDWFSRGAGVAFLARRASRACRRYSVLGSTEKEGERARGVGVLFRTGVVCEDRRVGRRGGGGEDMAGGEILKSQPKGSDGCNYG